MSEAYGKRKLLVSVGAALAAAADRIIPGRVERSVEEPIAGGCGKCRWCRC